MKADNSSAMLAKVKGAVSDGNGPMPGFKPRRKNSENRLTKKYH